MFQTKYKSQPILWYARSEEKESTKEQRTPSSSPPRQELKPVVRAHLRTYSAFSVIIYILVVWQKCFRPMVLARKLWTSRMLAVKQSFHIVQCIMIVKSIFVFMYVFVNIFKFFCRKVYSYVFVNKISFSVNDVWGMDIGDQKWGKPFYFDEKPFVFCLHVFKCLRNI